MAMVFEHNLHDVLSLVALTCRLGGCLSACATRRWHRTADRSSGAGRWLRTQPVRAS